jgi:hypothetical protein
MWRKTAMRARQKWLPQSVVMAVAESLDDSRARFDPAADFKNVMDGTWEPIPEEGDEDENDGNNAPSVSPPAVTQQQPPIVVQQPVEPPVKPTRATRTTAVNRANTPQQAAPPPPVQRQAAPPPPAKDEPPTDRWGEDPGISDNAPPTDDAPRPFFEAYVFDAQGEAASDAWTNAIGFARQFAFIATHVSAEEWPAFLEFNNDGIYEARAASQAAADIIDAVQAPTPSTTTPSEPVDTGLTLIPVQESRGSPDYVGWLNAVAPAIKALTAHTLLEWTEAHVPMVQTAPPTQRIKFASMISERATTLGIGTPTIVSTLMPSARKPQEPPAQEQPTAAPDPVERAANALLADIASFRTAGEGREWLLNAAVKSRGAMVRDARPDLNQAIERAYTAKLAELQGEGT